MMDWIGFIVCNLIAAYLLVVGCGWIWIAKGFAGEFSWTGLFLLAASIAIFWLTWDHKPFTIILGIHS